MGELQPLHIAGDVVARTDRQPQVRMGQGAKSGAGDR